MLTRKLLITALIAAGTVIAAGMPLTSPADTHIEFGYGAPVRTGTSRPCTAHGYVWVPGIGDGMATGGYGFPAIGSAGTATPPALGPRWRRRPEPLRCAAEQSLPLLKPILCPRLQIARRRPFVVCCEPGRFATVAIQQVNSERRLR